MKGSVAAVSRSGVHNFSKKNEESIRLVENYGVEGDAHAGATVKHRSRLSFKPAPPNLRQVHLIHGELHDELRAQGFEVKSGELGENITTRGLDLLSLPTGTLLRLGDTAVVEVKGLRNPCSQIEKFQKGLLAAVLEKRKGQEVLRKTGVMGVVKAGGDVRPGDTIRVELPAEPHRPLECV
jgi:MOSC domain-containing protein YiiM